MVNPYLKYTITSKLGIISNNAFSICVKNAVYFLIFKWENTLHCTLFQYSLNTINCVKLYIVPIFLEHNELCKKIFQKKLLCF